MSSIVSESAALPVLEPLSEATGQLIRPIDLERRDFLRIDLGPDGKQFFLKPIALRVVTPEEWDSVQKLRETASIEVIEHCGKQWLIDSRGPSYTASRGWANRIPFAKWEHPCWVVDATDIAALVIHHTWPSTRLVWGDDDSRTFYYFLLRRFLDQQKSAVLVADYKINRRVPDLPPDFVEHPDRPLLDHQKAGLVASLHRYAYGIFFDRGLGKTGTAIARINLEAKRKRAGRLPGREDNRRMFRTLILCPNQVRRNWEDEFGNFSTVPGKVTVLRGSQVGKARCLVDGVREEDDCAFAACILGHDSVGTMKEYLKRVEWDLIVVDESHKFKSPQAKRFKSLREVRDFPLVHQWLILTGSPIANSIMDLWAQFEVMGEGLSGFPSFSKFRDFYGIYKKLDADQGSIQKLIGMKNVPLLQERLARMTFMLTKEEARLNLPDKMYDIHEVEMTPRQAEMYKKMATHLAVQIGDLDDKTMSTDHVLTMLLRLAQITSGHVKWDNKIDPETMEVVGRGVTEQIPGGNPKIDAVVELLTEEGRDPRGKTIIWACWREDIAALSKRLAEEGIQHVVYHGGVKEKDREEAVQAFNGNPEVKVFIGNAATAGEGLNLVGYDWWNPKPKLRTYTDHEIFFSQNWSATERAQAEDRAHRKGTRQPVRITDLVVPGSIDEEIRARVLRKRQNAMMITDVREIMKRVLNLSNILTDGDD